MNKFRALTASACGLLALASACTVNTEEATPGEAVSAETMCQNDQGVNATLAALATATAKEIRRWLPTRDFQWNYSTGRLELSQWAYPRCPNRQCRNVQAILDFQKPEATGQIVFPGGSMLDPAVLRSRLYAYYQRQVTCNSRPDNHTGDDCPTEIHDLTFTRLSRGTCASDFWFHATKQNSTAPLQFPAQLKNQLIWVGYPYNPFLSFDIQGDDVKVDPTAGPVEGDPASSGACAAVCSKFSINSISGQCCACNGTQRTFRLSPFNSTYFICR